MQTPPTQYALGHDDAELQRLDAQAAALDAPTRLILGAAGLRPGMRVLDLGTGTGAVAFIAAELAGPEGLVVGVDRASEALDVARRRTAERGLEHVRFVESDLDAYRHGEPFDVLVLRLVLFHLADPVRALRGQIASLRDDALVIALDFDVGGVRTEPACPTADQARDWLLEAFRRAGADPVIGTRLRRHLLRAGLADVRTLAVTAMSDPGEPAGPALLSGVVRSLLPVITGAGIATADEVGIETLQQRVAAEVAERDAAIVLPTLVGAWGRVPAR